MLVDKLGLDIPPAPELTLEEICPREVRIAWKYSEISNSIHRHTIEVNGDKGGCSKANAEQLLTIGSRRDKARDSSLNSQSCPRIAIRYSSLCR